MANLGVASRTDMREQKEHADMIASCLDPTKILIVDIDTAYGGKVAPCIVV